VAWIYWINAGLITLLGYPLPRIVERRASAYDMLLLGTLLIVIGMAAVAGAVNVPLLLLCVVIMSFGMILSRPGEKIVSANLADPAARGSYLGLASFSLAVGGGIGNLTGGLIYDLGEKIGHHELPWLVFGIVGAATMAGLWQIRPSVQRAHHVMQARAAGTAVAVRSPRPAS
jgi:DHA1 family multidrug resistance protein-like MFS transporter